MDERMMRYLVILLAFLPTLALAQEIDPLALQSAVAKVKEQDAALRDVAIRVPLRAFRWAVAPLAGLGS